jgi:hypothetical protein
MWKAVLVLALMMLGVTELTGSRDDPDRVPVISAPLTGPFPESNDFDSLSVRARTLGTAEASATSHR